MQLGGAKKEVYVLAIISDKNIAVSIVLDKNNDERFKNHKSNAQSIKIPDWFYLIKISREFPQTIYSWSGSSL